jgi:hypothetical protein
MGILDTLLNISTFAVIGVLVWLYLKPEPDHGTADAERPSPAAPSEHAERATRGRES